MLALHGSGRTAEALAAFRGGREILKEELGIEPGQSLRAAHEAILADDPLTHILAKLTAIPSQPSATDAVGEAEPVPQPDPHAAVTEVAGEVRDAGSPPGVGQGGPGRTAPAEPSQVRRPLSLPGVRYSLPPDSAAFTGRHDEVRRITTAVSVAARTVGIVAIDGMPGVGKTSLAIHAAHLLRHRFPDRQLFIDLHAHTSRLEPVPPGVALAGLLTADGVDARNLPEDTQDRAGLWRDRMAGQRVLLVLDNAASSSQVVPLLPGDEDCLVLVTSRRHLGDLPGAVEAILLGALPPDKAQEMFLRLAPRAVTASGEAVAALVRLAQFLPLAISLLARVYARHPSWTLADLIAETRASLLTMTAEKENIAAAFEVSHRYLPPSRQRFFSCLGLHPGTTIDARAAAALAGVSVWEAAGHLEALHAEGLLTEDGYRRYGMHDLIRRYLQDRVIADPAADGSQGLARLLDYYQYTATLAEGQLARQTRAAPAGHVAAPPVSVPGLPDSTHALMWVRAERANLLACLDLVTRTGQHARVVSLTAAVSSLLRNDGPWTDAISRHTVAAQAARHLGDQLGEANALYDLAVVRLLTGGVQDARSAFEAALGIYRDCCDRRGQANVLNCLGEVRNQTGDYSGAANALAEALGIYRELGDRLGQANALRNLGVVRYLTGDFPGAAGALAEALGICRELSDRQGQASVLTYLGIVRQMTGDLPGAVRALEPALDISRELGDRLRQAITLTNLGIVRRKTSSYQGAADALEAGLEIFRELGDRLGQANTLHNLGTVRRLTGDYPGAASALEAALAIFRDLGTLGGEATALNEAGALHLDREDPGRARECYQQALRLARAIASSWDEADALAGMGRCAISIGDTAGAQIQLRQAREIFQRIGAAEAASVAAELEVLSPDIGRRMTSLTQPRGARTTG